MSSFSRSKICHSHILSHVYLSRYGFEIAYLTQAQLAAKKGYDVARKGGVLPAILNDIQVRLVHVSSCFPAFSFIPFQLYSHIICSSIA